MATTQEPTQQFITGTSLDDDRRAWHGKFARFYRAGDPAEARLEVLAARCLGITDGTPGPAIPYRHACRKCWDRNMVWNGIAWALKHRRGRGPLSVPCRHRCHRDGDPWARKLPRWTGPGSRAVRAADMAEELEAEEPTSQHHSHRKGADAELASRYIP